MIMLLTVQSCMEAILHQSDLDSKVQESLERAGLWAEVKDRLQEPGTSLSGGQQQRLCIARATSN